MNIIIMCCSILRLKYTLLVDIKVLKKDVLLIMYKLAVISRLIVAYLIRGPKL